MPIDTKRKYDIVGIIDIPKNEVSEELMQAIRPELRYQEANGSEHIYNASQILEAKLQCAPGIISELENINELCEENKVYYFRVIED